MFSWLGGDSNKKKNKEVGSRMNSHDSLFAIKIIGIVKNGTIAKIIGHEKVIRTYRIGVAI